MAVGQWKPLPKTSTKKNLVLISDLGAIILQWLLALQQHKAPPVVVQRLPVLCGSAKDTTARWPLRHRAVHCWGTRRATFKSDYKLQLLSLREGQRGGWRRAAEWHRHASFLSTITKRRPKDFWEQNRDRSRLATCDAGYFGSLTVCGHECKN